MKIFMQNKRLELVKYPSYRFNSALIRTTTGFKNAVEHSLSIFKKFALSANI